MFARRTLTAFPSSINPPEESLVISPSWLARPGSAPFILTATPLYIRSPSVLLFGVFSSSLRRSFMLCV